MNDRLLPCPSCARHVRASDTACPFCASALPEAPAMAATQSPGRLSRAALYAMGASAAAAAAAACTVTAVPVYGAPSVPIDGGQDAQNSTPVYGGPPADAADDRVLADAGLGDAASDADDGGDADSGAVPAYGAPP